MGTKSNKQKREEIKAKKELKAKKLSIKNAIPVSQVIESQIATAVKTARLTEEEVINEILYGSRYYFKHAHHNIRNFESCLTKIQITCKDNSKEIVKLLLNKTKILKSTFTEHSMHLYNIFELKGHWIRDILDWKPLSHNPGKQLTSLTRFLFCKYNDVPVFMDKEWEKRNNAAIFWYMELGKGVNIRKCFNLPVELSKRQAHLFKEAPDSYSTLDAFRYAQIVSLGGDEPIVKAILGTQIAHNFNKDKIEFIDSIFRYFINNPMLDKEQYGPIIDYVFNQKYVPAFDAKTQTVKIAQPNLTMKDRNPIVLLKEVDVWHKRLNRNTEISQYAKSWPSCGISGYDVMKNNTVHSIVELTTRSALIEEGSRLNHCVASYARSCAELKKAIYSLRTFNVHNSNSTTSLITIEVNLAEKRIMQLRGRSNERKSHPLIHTWAKESGLSISNYA